MSGPSINWERIRFVVFDVDGTLYDQKALRFQLLREMLSNALLSRSLTTPRILRAYRQLREDIGDEEVENFETVLIARTTDKTGIPSATVRAVIADWIEHRPLAHIRSCRYPHLDRIFAALKNQNKIIGIYSDYPAVEKLAAMELTADHIIAAGDREVGILKPHPRGLEILMQRAGAVPEETILIGDRPERDGGAARRARVMPLIRSNKPIDGWNVFSRFSDPVFAPLFNAADKA